MYNSETGKKMENKKLVLGAVIAVVVLLFAVLIGVLVKGSSEGDGTQDKSENSGLVFTNIEPLGNSMGLSMLEVLTDNVQTVVTMPEESNDANDALKVTVDASSLIKGIYFPYTTYSMLIGVSDERYYRVNVALNGEKYGGVLVQRVLPSKGQPYLYITIFDNSQDQDSVIKGLMSWAKSIYPDGFIATTENKNY